MISQASGSGDSGIEKQILCVHSLRKLSKLSVKKTLVVKGSQVVVELCRITTAGIGVVNCAVGTGVGLDTESLTENATLNDVLIVEKQDMQCTIVLS